MCKWGTDRPLFVKVDAALSHTGESRWAVKSIDACIAPIVSGLQAGGVDMLGSCCGHGSGLGDIELADGRTLLIVDSADAPDIKDVIAEVLRRKRGT